MADAIASHLREKAQALHEAVLALGVVVELYMASSGRNIDDMIFIVNHLYIPIEEMSADIEQLLREAIL